MVLFRWEWRYQGLITLYVSLSPDILNVSSTLYRSLISSFRSNSLNSPWSDAVTKPLDVAVMQLIGLLPVEESCSPPLPPCPPLLLPTTDSDACDPLSIVAAIALIMAVVGYTSPLYSKFSISKISPPSVPKIRISSGIQQWEMKLAWSFRVPQAMGRSWPST